MEKRLKVRPSRDWTKEMQISAANHQTEQGGYMKKLREVLKKLKGFATVQEEQQYQTTRPYKAPKGKNHQPKCTHGSTNGSSFIYTRGLPYVASTGGESLGTVKVQYPRIGESQGHEVGVDGLVVGASSKKTGGGVGYRAYRQGMEKGHNI